MDFRILGPLEVVENGRTLRVGRGKQRALLTLLLLRANRVVAQERLVDELWGESPPRTATTALHGYVSRLRRLLGEERLETRPPGYVLRLEPGELDLDRFEQLVSEGRHREALALWRGPALADFSFEPFAQGEIVRLEDLRLAALEARIEADLGEGRHAEVVGELEALVREHPLRERIFGLLMLALYRSGRQAEALDVFAAARSTLVEELGLEPGERLRELQRQILAQDPALDAAPAPPSESEPALLSNLPAPVTRLIGRKRELEELRDLLSRDDVRLVTVTGAGGIGKTRLALDLAAEAASEFHDGVWLVSLAAVSRPEHVLPAVSAVVSPRTDVVDVLRGKRALLVLDNFEQVADAAPQLGSLLRDAPGPKLLVTSRSRLRLSGEHEYPLETLAPTAAIELFTERATAVRPNFAPDSCVGEICRRLDHLPLALELAAARVNVLAPPALLERLERRFSVLTAGARDLPERQRSLRATIEWSYHLLDPERRALFGRLSVFAGTFSLEAAEAVCDADVDGVSALVEASVLVPVPPDRFVMLETIREYALQVLSDAGEVIDARRRHANWFLELAERAGEGALAADVGAWLGRIETDLDNVRAALEWALEEDPDLALDRAAALWRFWIDSGRGLEGVHWLEAAWSDDAPVEIRKRALRGLTVIALSGEEVARVVAVAEERLRLAQETGDRAEASGALAALAAAAGQEKDLGRARALYEQALAEARGAGRQDLAQRTVLNLGLLAWEQGALDEARRIVSEYLARSRVENDELEVARALAISAAISVDEDAWDIALPPLREAFVLASKIGYHTLFLSLLTSAATALLEGREAAMAAQLIGAVEALAEQQGNTSWLRLTAFQRASDRARNRLGAELFDLGRTRGRSLGEEAAVRLAVAALGRHTEKTR